MREHHSAKAHAKATAWAQSITADPTTVFLDLETTGKEKTSHIVDIGIVAIDGTVLMDLLVRPEIAIPSEASAVHGITNELVIDAPDWILLAQDVRSLIDGRRICIYNADYDTAVLTHNLARAGITYAVPGDCAMKAFAEWEGAPGKWPGSYRWWKLEEAAAKFGIPSGDHRALADAIACKEVVCAMAGGQYVCPNCNARLRTSHAICECRRWVHEGKEHPPPGQQALFALPDASRYRR